MQGLLSLIFWLAKDYWDTYNYIGQGNSSTESILTMFNNFTQKVALHMMHIIQICIKPNFTFYRRNAYKKLHIVAKVYWIPLFSPDLWSTLHEMILVWRYQWHTWFLSKSPLISNNSTILLKVHDTYLQNW